MRKSKFTGEQIAYALKQAGLGTPVAEICRKLVMSEVTFYTYEHWKKKLEGRGMMSCAD